ncbi:MAG: ankyrin repeat domain-containing protein [bacterium]
MTATPTPADLVERFFAAVVEGATADVRALLDAEPTLLAAVAPEGIRAPLAALYAGHAALADELAARSAPLDVHEASAFDDNGRLRTLLEHDPAAVTAWSLDGRQPLHVACHFGRVEAARQLIDEDAPVNEPSRTSVRTTALTEAAAGGHSELVWLLVASGADVSAGQLGGRTPLHLAAAIGDAESIRALLSAGADPRTPDDEGRTPGELATERVRSLLS